MAFTAATAPAASLAVALARASARARTGANTPAPPTKNPRGARPSASILTSPSRWARSTNFPAASTRDRTAAGSIRLGGRTGCVAGRVAGPVAGWVTEPMTGPGAATDGAAAGRTWADNFTAPPEVITPETTTAAANRLRNIT